MTITRKELYAALIVAILLAVGGALALSAYISSGKDTTRADQVKQDVDKQIEAMHADLKDALSAIAQQKQDVKTPEQVVRVIPQYVTLPTPPTVQPAQSSPSNEASSLSKLPDSPSTVAKGVYFPPEDVKPLFDKLADGKVCELKLGECQKEIPLLTQRAESAEKAMNGGGFWRRLKSNSKWFVIGGAAGAGAVLATRR